MKRLFLLILLVAMVFFVAACGGAAPSVEEAQEAVEEAAAEVEEAAEAAVEEAQEVAEEAEATVEEAVEEAAEAVEETVEELTLVAEEDPLGTVVVAPGDPIRIASALVIAGPNETLGVDSQTGVEVAIKQRGEVAGHPVELIPEDGACSAEGGQTAATKIASDDSIVAVVGHSCSSSCTPAAPIYNDAGLVMISPSCTAPALTGEGHVDSFLRTAHNDNVQGRVMAEFVFNELGFTTAATIHDGSPYAEQLQQVFADTFAELGGTITAQEAVNVGDTDMRPVLTSIATASPEFLYYPIFIAEGGFITTQSKEIAGLEETILAGAEGMISPDFIAAAGEAANGMFISGPNLEFTGDTYEQFLADYVEILGQEPISAFHAHAYDAANMIFDAIEAVATTDAEGNTVIGKQALRDALYATSGLAGITGTVGCNENGDCADPEIVVNEIQEGEYVPVFGGAMSAEGEEAMEEEAMAEAEAVEEVEDAAVALVEGEYTIGIMQLASHPALDAEREGAVQALADNGFIDGENLTIDYQNAEGDIATLTTIAQKFVDDDVDLIFTITTPAIQAAYNVTQDLEGPPVVFAAVTDPYAAGVATAPDDHPAWITGIQGMPPVEDAMAVIKEVLPDIQSIGMIWNTAEKNSEVATGIARDTAAEMGIEFIEANIADSSEVQTAAESLVAQGVDAFFVSTDTTVVSGFEALVKVANENQVPLFANDPASSERGAVAALGLDYFQDGLDAGNIIVTILKGEATPAEIPIVRQRAGLLAINLNSVEAQAVELPAEVVERAEQVFE